MSPDCVGKFTKHVFFASDGACSEAPHHSQGGRLASLRSALLASLEPSILMQSSILSACTSQPLRTEAGSARPCLIVYCCTCTHSLLMQSDITTACTSQFKVQMGLPARGPIYSYTACTRTCTHVSQHLSTSILCCTCACRLDVQQMALRSWVRPSPAGFSA